MSVATSNWIPRKRIRFAVALAWTLVTLALAGSLWSPFAFILLLPALGAGWAAFVMLQIRRQLSHGWQRRIHQHATAELGFAPEAAASVLDIGCGDASLLIALLEQSPHLNATGIDYWGANWDYAKSACEARLSGKGLRASFRRMDAAHLEFPDNSFDAVVSVMCFHEVKVPSGAPMCGPLLAVSEALRVLKPGGTFVLIDRFADASDYGDGTGLAAILKQTNGLRHAPIVAALGVPWPLKTPRALGPVEVLSGKKM